MKTYTITFIKKGKNWKKFINGIDDFVEDNKRYKLVWKIDGFWNAVRGWFGILFKRSGEFIKGDDYLMKAGNYLFLK